MDIDAHAACRACEIKNYISCDASKLISSMAEEKGIEADFKFCIFNKIAKKFKLSILREILEDD